MNTELIEKIIDVMSKIEKGNLTGELKKKNVMVKISEIFDIRPDDVGFIIDLVIYLSKHRGLLKKFNKKKCCII